MKLYSIKCEIAASGDRWICKSVPDTLHNSPFSWGKYVRVGRSASFRHA